MRERLFREARSAGVLSHPNIVTIYDMAEEDGVAYISMEYVDGPTLDELMCSGKPLVSDKLFGILRQTAVALDYAHSKGIVHRDIKPANIMVHEDGTAKVTDFGVAKIVSQQMTQAGTIMGTPSYMSPEQVQGGAISGKADQFSLGVIAYEMLTGEKPFTADYLPTLLFKIVREEPVPPQRLNATLSADVEIVMRRALAKSAADRYDTCLEFINALASACNGSGKWIPLPRGTSANMPTAGSGEQMGATLGATVAENLAETMAAPLTVHPPSERRPLPPTEEMRLPKFEPSPPRQPAVKRSETPAPTVMMPTPKIEAPAAPPSVPLVPPSPLAADRALDDERQSANSNTGRNVIIGLLAAVAIGIIAFFVWFTTQSPSQTAAPLVVDGTIPKPASQDPPPAQPVTAEPTPSPAAVLSPVAKAAPPKTPPGPTEASFQLTTMPAGADAVFDGNAELHCSTPCTLNLPMGRHTLVLTSKGFRDAQRVFNLPSDPGLIVNLEPTMGTLSLVTTPAGLTVIIDGQEQARKTPADFSLSVGDQRVQKKRGSEKQEFTAAIRDNVVSQKSIEWGQ